MKLKMEFELSTDLRPVLGVFLASILFFDYILLPSIEFITFSITGESSLWSLIRQILSYLFTFLWVIPLFVLSKIINTFWFQDM